MGDNTSPADTALAELGALIGISGLKFDAAQCCQLAFDGDCLTTLVCAPAVQRLVLSCPLAAAHTLISADTLLAMLRANFMGTGCAGGSFGVSPDDRPCLQFQMAYAELSGATLLSRIEIMLGQVDSWVEHLRRGESERAPVDAMQPTQGLADGERPPRWMLDRA